MQVSVQDAETQLSHLLDLIQDGEEIVIHRDGKAVARLVAPETSVTVPFGAMQGEFDLQEGWDRPLSPEEADAFWEGKL
jgi:antitoxin (DNA-binding transcriptional repressor) of toxin-antitoxin stability system